MREELRKKAALDKAREEELLAKAQQKMLEEMSQIDLVDLVAAEAQEAEKKAKAASIAGKSPKTSPLTKMLPPPPKLTPKRSLQVGQQPMEPPPPIPEASKDVEMTEASQSSAQAVASAELAPTTPTIVVEEEGESQNLERQVSTGSGKDIILKSQSPKMKVRFRAPPPDIESPKSSEQPSPSDAQLQNFFGEMQSDPSALGNRRARQPPLPKPSIKRQTTVDSSKFPGMTLDIREVSAGPFLAFPPVPAAKHGKASTES